MNSEIGTEQVNAGQRTSDPVDLFTGWKAVNKRTRELVRDRDHSRAIEVVGEFMRLPTFGDTDVNLQKRAARRLLSIVRRTKRSLGEEKAAQRLHGAFMSVAENFCAMPDNAEGSEYMLPLKAEMEKERQRLQGALCGTRKAAVTFLHSAYNALLGVAGGDMLKVQSLFTMSQMDGQIATFEQRVPSRNMKEVFEKVLEPTAYGAIWVGVAEAETSEEVKETLGRAVEEAAGKIMDGVPLDRLFAITPWTAARIEADGQKDIGQEIVDGIKQQVGGAASTGNRHVHRTP